MRLNDFSDSLIYIATYIVIIPIAVAIYFYKFQPKALKILLVGMLITLLFDILILLFLDFKNTILYFFSIIDLCTMSIMFSTVIYRSQIKKTIFIIAGLLLFFIGFDAFFISGTNTNGYSNTAVKVFILILSLYYLSQLFQDESIEKLNKQPFFWICIGLISYNAVGFFDVFSTPMLNYSQYFYRQFYMVWCIVAIFMYLWFAYAFWLSRIDSHQ